MTTPTWYVNNSDIALARIMIYVYAYIPFFQTVQVRHKSFNPVCY